MNMYMDYLVSNMVHLIGNAVTRPIATIFTLHRVCTLEKDNLSACEELSVDPEFLDNFIKLSRRRGYNFISMDDLVSVLLSEKRIEKAFVISIDDGYKDTYSTAYPILKKQNVPFIFFVSTSFPDRTAILWWYVIQELITNNNVIVLTDGRKISCATLSEKQKAFTTLRRIILRMGRHVQERIPHMLSRYDNNLHWQNSKLMIDWEDIITMSKDELCTIGAHTEKHFGLRFETAENVLGDFLLCKSKLENKIGMQVRHLSFPYGSAYSVGCRESYLAAKAGFTTAVTTYSGVCHGLHRYMLHSLPRVNFTQGSCMQKYIWD